MCPANRRPEGKAVRPVGGSAEKPVRAGRRECSEVFAFSLAYGTTGVLNHPPERAC